MRAAIARHLDHDPEFEWRGQYVTRIENLSDIVFALAFGMLVSATTPPGTYQELLPHLMSIVPVTVGFLFMVLLWNDHFIFFRRYGIADQKIIWLNGILLLLILFLAYPLRFAFESLFAYILSQFGSDQRMDQLGISTYRQAGNIIALFYVGYGLANLIYQSMYAYARQQAETLELTYRELQLTRRSIWRYRGEVLIALIIAPLAAFSLIGPFAGALGLLSWPSALLVDRWIRLDSPTGAEPETDADES
ncbi:MAG: TMEM175 family protein [Henriciella sp.]|nr:TMEM175 family protein [Henriciella sp.]